MRLNPSCALLPCPQAGQIFFSRTSEAHTSKSPHTSSCNTSTLDFKPLVRSVALWHDLSEISTSDNFATKSTRRSRLLYLMVPSLLDTFSLTAIKWIVIAEISSGLVRRYIQDAALLWDIFPISWKVLFVQDPLKSTAIIYYFPNL